MLKLPDGVELEEFVDFADFLCMNIDLQRITVDDEAEFAQQLRAKLFKERRASVTEAVQDTKTKLLKGTQEVTKLLFIQQGDSIPYINSGSSDLYETLGSYILRSDGDKIRKNYEWASSASLRNHFQSEITDLGLDATWANKSVELSGTRGVEFANSYEVETVRGFRWCCTITIPAAEPPAKRARVTSI